ncbi:MAG: ATP-binding region ATPase domain protein [Bacteroidetes bacterium]|nr:ATP-binding region ATPase domain protein [Bacteroidota bacterium]
MVTTSSDIPASEKLLKRGFVRWSETNPERRSHRPGRTLSCLILAASLAHPVLGQPLPPAIEYITIGQAFCFLHDSNGFLWIGSQEGLARYDGYGLKFYTHVPFDSTSLSDNWVSVIQEDKNGNLWVGTWGGALNCFNQRTERFTRFLQGPTGSTSIHCKNISSLVVNDDGSLWIGTQEDGLLHMSIDSSGNARYKKYDFSTAHEARQKERENAVWSLLKDTEGRLWIGTFENGLVCLDAATDERSHYRHDPQDPASLSSNSVSSLCEDDSGNIWIGTGNAVLDIRGRGLARFDRKRHSFTSFMHDPSDSGSTPSNSVNALLIDHTNTLWIGTYDNGLYSVPLEHLEGRSEPVFTKRENLGGYMIYAVYEDRLGSIWIGLLAMHLCKLEGQQTPFMWYRHISGNPHSLRSNAVACIYADRNDRIWFGYNFSGLTRFDPSTGTYMHFTHDPANANGLSSNRVNAICEDSDGMVWVGTYDRGIDILNPSDESFAHIRAAPDNPFGLRSDNIKFLLTSRSGDIWVSTLSEGLQLYDRERKHFTFFDIDSSTSDDERTSILYEDGQGTLWVGTMNNGLYGVKASDGRLLNVRHYAHDPENRNSLSQNFAVDIIQSRVRNRNALWIATTVGLNKLDVSTGTFTHYFRKDGLPHDFVLKLLEDNAGNIWASTAYELCVYNVNTGTFSRFGKDDGLPLSGFAGSRQNSAVTRGGQLLFGAAYGVLGFYPEKVLANPAMSRIMLTDFKIWYEHAPLDTAIQFKRVIPLNHDQNTLSFEFSDLNLTMVKRNQFAYKLEGLHDDWISIGKARTVSFTSIDPGTYVFRVSGATDGSVLTGELAALTIIIAPPWWKTVWAYVAYVFIIGTLLGVIYRARMRRVALAHQLQLEQLETTKMRDVDRMKSRFFANISHEFRTPLTLILGPVAKWRERAHEQDEEKDLGVAARNAKRLLRLVNQLLDLSKLEAGALKLRASRMNIVPLARAIALSFETSDGSRGIALNVEAEEEFIEVFCDKEMLEKILGNLLSNAFKFTPKGGSVTCAVRRNAVASEKGMTEVAEIDVIDTGIGIPREQMERIFNRFYQVDSSHTREHEGSGIGLALVKEVVELHHGTIRVQSEIGRGTTFSIQLPLGRAHLKDDEIVEVPADVGSAVQEQQSSVVQGDAAETEKGALSAAMKSDKPIILVVEDNADVRTYIKDYLASAYQVLEAQDGEEGIEKAREIIPDLVISDVMMPKKDGYEVCKTLKDDVTTSHVPIILLTAKAGNENKIEGLETGADDYLIKPFEPKELLARVKNLIDLRRRLRERFKASAPLRPGEVAVTSMDDAFLGKVLAAVEQHMGNEHLRIEALGAEVGMSRVQLHRKLIALTNLSPGEFVRYMRLHRAMELLQKNAGTVSEIAYTVGFSDPSYFSKCFHKQFGKAPTEVEKASVQAAHPGKIP